GGGEPECGDPPRRRRDDLRGVDHRAGAALAARGRGSIRARPMHARLGSPDRAAAVGLRDAVPRLRRDLRESHTARPRAAAAGHGGAVVRGRVIAARSASEPSLPVRDRVRRSVARDRYSWLMRTLRYSIVGTLHIRTKADRSMSVNEWKLEKRDG